MENWFLIVKDTIKKKQKTRLHEEMSEIFIQNEKAKYTDLLMAECSRHKISSAKTVH